MHESLHAAARAHGRRHPIEGRAITVVFELYACMYVCMYDRRKEGHTFYIYGLYVYMNECM